MKKVFFKGMKIAGIIMLLLSIGLTYSWADSLTIKQKKLLQKKIAKLTPRPIVGANLIPTLWVNCGCDCTPVNILERKGYMLVDKIIVYVYNNGDSKSSTAKGKVEFYDLVKQRRVVHSFTVMPTKPKQAAYVKRAIINGTFLIKKSAGIKVSVTFQRGIKPIPITNYSYEKDCSVVY